VPQKCITFKLSNSINLLKRKIREGGWPYYKTRHVYFVVNNTGFSYFQSFLCADWLTDGEFHFPVKFDVLSVYEIHS
jgi:hypothetical protein